MLVPLPWCRTGFVGGGVVSAGNPTHIIAEHALRKAAWLIREDAPVRWVACVCGWEVKVDPTDEDTESHLRRIHAAHVVSKLTDAGYSIVPTPRGHSPQCVFTGNRCHSCVCGTGVDPQFGNIGPHTQEPNLGPGSHDHGR